MREYKPSPEIHGRFLAIRSALGKSQAEMSAALGYSDSYYSKLEVGTDDVRKNVVYQMCLTFHVSYDYLVFGEGPMFVEADVRRERMSRLFDGLSVPCQKFLLDMVEYAVAKRKAEEEAGRTEAAGAEEIPMDGLKAPDTALE